MSPDGLTGLQDARALSAEGARLEREAPERETHWFLVADVDRFKRFNDRHGHPAGDDALVRIGEAIRAALPAGVFLARAGGDEFAALVPTLALGGARTAAEAARAAVEALQLASRLTVSIGLAGWLPASEPFAEAFHRADVALYAAKTSGENRVHVSGSDG